MSRGTVRLRLTLLYGGLFLLSGLMLLTITYLLVRHSTGHQVLVLGRGDGATTTTVLGSDPAQLDPRLAAGRAQADRQRASMLNELLAQSGLALAGMAVASIGLGWVVAGRVLAPLRSMTATARRISHENLHQRLAVIGPRDEFTELGDTIDELLGRLEDAFSAQRRFVANASHELRTPLAMMRTSLDVAAGKPQPRLPELAALDVKLREGLDQADDLVESFLALARAQHHDRSDHTAVDMTMIVADTLERLDNNIRREDLHVHRRLAAATARGNRALLERMIVNLITNAVRHNETGGWIDVELRRDGDAVRLMVENGGPSLTAADVTELVEPFQRGAGQRIRSADGVGLGLPIAATIAAAHDAELRLQPGAEGGLRVEVELPAFDEDSLL